MYNAQIYKALANIAGSRMSKQYMGNFYGYQRAIQSIKESGIIIDSLSSLEQIKGLKYVGEKTFLAISNALNKAINAPAKPEKVNPHKNYMTRTSAVSFVRPVITWIKKNNLYYTICGSYRRGKTQVGDMDILIQGNVFPELPATINGLEVLAKGEKKIKLKLHKKNKAFEIDLRIVKQCNWGTSLLYFTGSADFNIGLRRRAKRLGYKLNEYCITQVSTGKETYFSNEEGIFEFLGVPYVLPEDRL